MLCGGMIRWPRGRAALMIYVLKKIPPELRRFAVLGVVAAMLATAIIYSRDEHVPSESLGDGSRQAFQQPNYRQQAEGWFIPTPRSEEISGDKVEDVADAIPLPRARPITPGFYYELVRAQGDGEGEYVFVERRCIPKVDMPKPCYLPERSRRNFPLRRE
jgi:hypothetical protein